VYQLVVDDRIAGLRHAAEQADIGVHSGVEEEASRSAVKGCDGSLETLGVG
jgi:hypothetical protein